MSASSDDALTIKQIPALVPSRPAVTTIYRWIERGIRAQDGTAIKLRSFKSAGRRMVLRTDLEEFLSRCRDADRVAERHPAGATYNRAAFEAAQALEDLGA